MELFKEPLRAFCKFMQSAEAKAVSRSFLYDPALNWPEGSSLVLREDTAAELGGAKGSLFLIIWTDGKKAISTEKITIVGPDLTEELGSSLPLSLIILVSGSFQDEYGTYQSLQDAIFDTELSGVSLRIWPDRQKIWCRVSKNALNQGFNLTCYGSALLKRLSSLAEVKQAEIFFITEVAVHLAKDLAAVAEKTKMITDTLLMIYDQLNFDCNSCDYQDICTEVTGLREIHQRLHKEHEQP
jgi:CO dehydrogenase/acetyl-CoA synthase beta subunit